MKSTKKALLLSITSMLLCVAMLMGTTYAWFTDSVTSGRNKIIAGNLDVEVTHTNAYVTTPKTVKNENKMFVDKNGNEILWEPGAVSFENLTVANVGTLAFKYSMNMNVTDYNAVEGTNDTLLDALKVLVLTGDDILEEVDREAVLDLEWDNAQTLGDFRKNDGKLYPVGNNDELPSTEDFQLIVYWQPTENDDRWNLKNGLKSTDGDPLFIEFGINLVATQLTYEKDSFGDDYDDLILPVLPSSINKTFQTTKIKSTITSGGDVELNLGEGEESVIVKNVSTNTGVGSVEKGGAQAVVEALVKEVDIVNIDTEQDQDSVIYVKVETTEEPSVSSAKYDITLSATMTYTDKTTGQKVEKRIEELHEEQLGGKLVTVFLNLGAGLENVKVSHKSVPMTKYDDDTFNAEGFFYNLISGLLTIKSKSFSPFTVEYEYSGCAHEFDGWEYVDQTTHKVTCVKCKKEVVTDQHFLPPEGQTSFDSISFNGTPITETAETENYSFDASTRVLKLKKDVVANLEFAGKGNATLDLNGCVLKAETSNMPTIYVKSGYNLTVIDTNKTVEHKGYIGNDYGWRAGTPEGTAGTDYMVDYTIKGGIITNVEDIKRNIDGYGIVTDIYSVVKMYGGTIAGININTSTTFGDVAGICIGHNIAGTNCVKGDYDTAKFGMYKGAYVVGCAGMAGGIEVRGDSEAVIDGGVIEYCDAVKYLGGGLAISGNTTSVIFEYGRISNCHAAESAAAIFANGGLLEFNHGTIENCYADEYGGAIKGDDGIVRINGGLFKNCGTNGDGGFYNGTGADLVINGGTFENCFAHFGGAIGSGGNVTINSGIFKNCEANRDEKIGGVVDMWGSGVLTVGSDVSFIGNKGHAGSVIGVEPEFKGSITVEEGATFENNGDPIFMFDGADVSAKFNIPESLSAK